MSAEIRFWSMDHHGARPEIEGKTTKDNGSARGILLCRQGCGEIGKVDKIPVRVRRNALMEVVEIKTRSGAREAIQNSSGICLHTGLTGHRSYQVLIEGDKMTLVANVVFDYLPGNPSRDDSMN